MSADPSPGDLVVTRETAIGTCPFSHAEAWIDSRRVGTVLAVGTDFSVEPGYGWDVECLVAFAGIGMYAVVMSKLSRVG